MEGVLVMTAWTEDAGDVRIRLRWTVGTIDPTPGEAVAGSAEEALELARAWISEVAAAS